MKKGIIILISIIAIVGIVVISLIFFKGKNNVENTNEPNNSDNTSTNKVVSITDNDIYYIKINGTKFKAGDKVSNVSKIGLKQKEKDLEKTIPSNRYLLATSIINDNNKDIFKVVPLNSTAETIKYSDAVFGGIELGDVNYNKISEETLSFDFEFIGGIKLGSTYDEIVKVFGEPDFKTEIKADEKLNRLAYTTYTYSSGYKGFKFIIDESGKTAKIEWNNYDYNEK